MKRVKKGFKILLKILITLVVLILFYLFMAWLLPYVKVNSDYREEKEGIELFIKSNGVHVDIIMPAKAPEINWFEFLPASDFEAVDERFEYVSIGWGDKGFYLNTPEWKDLTVSTACNAAFGLGETAMHVTYIYRKPKLSENCKRIIVSSEQYKLLINYIHLSFETKDNLPIAIVHPGYSNYDCFYEATGKYSMFKTCNVWTGNALKSMGIEIGVWTPFQNGIINNFKD